MTSTLQQETKKKKLKNSVWFIVKIILFITLIIFTAYTFIHSPAWINKINHLLNREEAFAYLQPGMGEINTIEETIIIPQANIYVSLVSINSLDRKDIEEAVKQGLALRENENKLLFIGNYSDYFWKEGEYKYILSSLGNLRIGDLMGVNHKNNFTKYQVTDIKTVKAKDFSELEKIDADLIIASDWPPSFTHYKLVLEAKRID